MSAPHSEPPRPSPGTVYGRGGVDVRESAPRRSLHPSVAGLAVAASLVAVLTVGYAAWRSTAGSPTAGAATPTAAVTTEAAAAAASPSETPSPTPTVATFGTGRWVFAPGDDPEKRLTVNGDYAYWSATDQTALTVVAGLSDDSCFSFQAEDGRYMRHFDYRLRFDDNDGSDLFQQDATFCPDGGLTADAVRLHSTNYPEYYLHRRDNDLYIDKPSGDDFAAESTFRAQEAP
ncbi:AbfB domain-containing protein [Actinoplanes sp. NPDC051851]|uniref:AbfB domain-containing protein n=1 Tax=Actinoplanes sp. NPDC051851 TaxID=3154753 RepID=UPI003423715F